MNLAPIVLFVYNRPNHTSQTISSLKKNELANQSDLIIYSDGPKRDQDIESVNFVRQFLKEINGFKTLSIIERDSNWGLAKSIISGVTEVVNKYGKIIVLEDDLITSPHFLQFMNDALNFYQDEESIFSITGYNPPENILKIPASYNYDIYFNYRCHSWGWGTWKNRWDKADWEVSRFYEFINNRKAIKSFQQGGGDLLGMLINQIEGRIDSWAIRWCFAHFQENAYCVYPCKSLLNNIGFDNSGVHCSEKAKEYFTGTINNSGEKYQFTKHIELNDQIMNNFRKVFKPGIFQRLFTLIRAFQLRKRKH